MLGYCATVEEAVTEAAAHRFELMKDLSLNDEDKELSPITLYEIRLKSLTLDLVLPVFNRQTELAEAMTEEMTRVGVVE